MQKQGQGWCINWPVLQNADRHQKAHGCILHSGGFLLFLQPPISGQITNMCWTPCIFSPLMIHQGGHVVRFTAVQASLMQPGNQKAIGVPPACISQYMLHWIYMKQKATWNVRVRHSCSQLKFTKQHEMLSGWRHALVTYSTSVGNCTWNVGRYFYLKCRQRGCRFSACACCPTGHSSSMGHVAM